MEKLGKGKSTLATDVLQPLHGITLRENCAPKGATQSGGEITQRIKELVRKREFHEKRIQQLLSVPTGAQDKTRCTQLQQSNECSQILGILADCEIDGGSGSCCDLEGHVNLLASVGLQTEIELPVVHEQIGCLYASLVERFPHSQIRYNFEEEGGQSKLLGFQALGQYLSQRGIWEGLFVQKKIYDGKLKKFVSNYYGTKFHFGRYQEVFVSEKQVEEDEMDLLIYYNQSSSKSSDYFKNEPTVIDIKYLLLKRLLKNLGTANCANFPFYLQNLFGSPIRNFSIRKTYEFLQLGDLISRFNKNEKDPETYDSQSKRQDSQIVLYGFNPVNQSIKTVEKWQKNKILKNYSGLLGQLSRVTVIEEAEIQVKSIPLKCHRNHFVVVTISLTAKGNFYLTVGSSLAKRHQYRLALLNKNGKLVQYQITRSGQFMYSYLLDEEYELYIAPFEDNERKEIDEKNQIQESFQLVKDDPYQLFHLWIQGTSLVTRHGQALLEVKLKEKYNTYTKNIVTQYLKQKRPEDKSALTNGKKSLSVKDCRTFSKQLDDQKIIIKRTYLNFLGLAIDQFQNIGNRKLLVKYESALSLCDQLYNKQQISVNGDESEIICREDSVIQSLRLVSETSTQELQVKRDEYYL